MLSAEKRSLLQFVSVFVGLNTLFLITLSMLYYDDQKNIYMQIRESAMTNYAETAYESIYDLDDINRTEEYLLHDSRFDTALLDKQGRVLYATADDFGITHRQGFFGQGRYFFYVNTIELDRIKNVRYLALRGKNIDAELTKTKEMLYVFLIVSILFFGVTIYILSRLFLRPLREYIELLDDFIRDAAHELNTPVAVLSMSLERIRKEELGEKNARALRHMQLATKTLEHLYGDLSFLIAQPSDDEESDIRVDLLVLERVEYFMPLADAKGISFVTKLRGTTMRIDRLALNRIVDNLISNAIKYNRKNGKIVITLNRHALSVIDTGVGFERGLFKEIFNRYQRFDSANGGFGLGLDIVRTLCDRYGITIAVRSKIQKGTIFRLSWKSSR